MSYADLTLAAWLDLSDQAADRTAAAIARATGARLIGVERQPTRGRTAFFEHDEVRFALVPGGAAWLGHDGSRFVPTERQAADFARAAADWDITEPLGRYLDRVTSPVREAVVPALLVAVEAEQADALVTADEDEDDEFGHAWMLAGLRDRGWRPPSPDEWEWACGAGATTLFRWGDDYPEGKPHGDVPLIREPNRFGLVIAANPYDSELTTDPAVLCGGDGGAALCGGYGPFLSWITLATAYRDAALAEVVEEEGLTEETPVRPVLPIP